MDSVLEKEDECIFKNDPCYLKSLLGKKVKVVTVENRVHEGLVYVIDPVFKTVVLTDSEACKIDVILNHAIKAFDVIDENADHRFLVDPSDTEVTSCEDRKQEVKTWLEKNLINVTETGHVLKFKDELIIMPPYGPEQCLCSNTIILEKVQNILRRMPECK